MVSLVNSHTNTARIGWDLWEIDLRFAWGSPPGWSQGSQGSDEARNLFEELGGEHALVQEGLPLLHLVLQVRRRLCVFYMCFICISYAFYMYSISILYVQYSCIQSFAVFYYTVHILF